MSQRCTICERALSGQPTVGDERPCYVPGDQRCYELGYQLQRTRAEKAEKSLRRALRVEERITVVV